MAAYWHRITTRLSLLALVAVVGGATLSACGTANSGATTPATGGNGGASATRGITSGTPAPTRGTTKPVTTPRATSGAQTPAAGATPAPTSTRTTGASSGPVNSAYKIAPAPVGSGADKPGADPDATLTLNINNEPDTLDPQIEAFSSDIQISSKVFAPLLTINEKNQVAANVATSMQVSKDGRTYTFKLRKTSYTNGQPVTANDYAWAIRRTCDPALNGQYSNIAFDIVGCQDWRTADLKKTSKSRLQQLESVVDDSIKALDDYTLQIKLIEPAGYFPYVMATWITYPTPKASVEKGGANWWKDPSLYIGNGPFNKVVSHQNKVQWVLGRNDDYFAGKPGVKTLVYKEISSSQTAFLAYRQGQLDVLSLDPTLLPQIERDATLKSQLHRTVGANTYYVGFDDKDKPFSDVRVRQAFAYAINRKQYIDQINHGSGVSAGQFLYKGIAGYQDRVQQTFDPAKAKQLLAEAGYPNGRGFPSLELNYDNTDPSGKQRAIFWSQMFRQVLSVNIVPTPTDPAELQADLSARNGKLKIYLLGWGEDYPHPQDWLSLVFGNNSSLAPYGWNDPHFNQLVNKADKLPIQQAAPIYQQADAYLAKMAPVAFYIHEETLYLIKPNLKGYVRYPTTPIDLNRQIQKIYKTK